VQITLGFPDRAIERQLFEGKNTRALLHHVKPVTDLATWNTLRESITLVQASGSLLDYVQRLVDFTRYSGHFQWGLSPRAALGLMQVARAWAMMQQRKFLVPEDIQAVFGAVVNHRLRYQMRNDKEADPARLILDNVDVIG
jgi:MoxR-like ATPase